MMSFPQGGSGRIYPDSCKLMASNLSIKVPEQELIRMFTEYGSCRVSVKL